MRIVILVVIGLLSYLVVFLPGYFLLVRGEHVDGEVYVDLDTAAERAPEFGVTMAHEALRYVAHGVLHLCGYDDATEADRTGS